MKDGTALLLNQVHDRIGGLGLNIQTFGGDGTVEIRWRRDYDGVWSDERFVSARNIDQALRYVIAYEDEADAEEQAEQLENFG